MMMTIEEIKAAAAEVAAAMQVAGDTLPDEVRQRFVALRAALYQRGIFDPMLARFDSATVAKAPNGEIAAELVKLAETL
jgi:hypothetical protein